LILKLFFFDKKNICKKNGKIIKFKKNKLYGGKVKDVLLPSKKTKK